MGAKTNTIPALQSDLLDNPLVYVTASQKCERTMLKLLDRVVAGEREWPAIARQIVTYLASERVYRIADLTEDLFPLLLAASEPEDEIEEMLERIATQSFEIDKIVGVIADQLTECVATGLPPRDNELFCAIVARFSRIAEQNVMLENAIVLPIARKRLNRSDLTDLSRRMRQRRASPGLAGVIRHKL